MPKNDVSQYHGAVHVCPMCKISEGVITNCDHCKGRGFVADCTNCNATGQTTVPVAGAASGTMSSTCAPCAGKGVFGVNRPADWTEPVPEPEKTLATV